MSLACPLQTLQIDAQPIPVPAQVPGQELPAACLPRRRIGLEVASTVYMGPHRPGGPRPGTRGLLVCMACPDIASVGSVLGPVPSILSLISPWPSKADFAVKSLSLALGLLSLYCVTSAFLHPAPLPGTEPGPPFLFCAWDPGPGCAWSALHPGRWGGRGL